jgi:hypothetical protein
MLPYASTLIVLVASAISRQSRKSTLARRKQMGAVMDVGI